MNDNTANYDLEANKYKRGVKCPLDLLLKSCFFRGKDDFIRGKTALENPYDSLEMRIQWNSGWHTERSDANTLLYEMNYPPEGE